MPELRLGVLAIQGGFEAHCEVLRELGADVREVRLPADLEGVDARRGRTRTNFSPFRVYVMHSGNF